MQHGYLAADQLQDYIRAFIPKNHSSVRPLPNSGAIGLNITSATLTRVANSAKSAIERTIDNAMPAAIHKGENRSRGGADRCIREFWPKLAARWSNRPVLQSWAVFRRINDLSQRRYAHHGAMTMHAAVMRIDLASYPPALANANEAISMMDNNANPNRFNGLPFR